MNEAILLFQGKRGWTCDAVIIYADWEYAQACLSTTRTHAHTRTYAHTGTVLTAGFYSPDKMVLCACL